MTPLFTVGAYEIVPSADAPDRLELLHRGRKACDIAGQCAAKLQWLFAQLQSPSFEAGFGELTNCHGLAEYVQGRALKWRNKPKYLGTEVLPPNADLPSDLPLTYQFMNWEQKAVHSGVVLGRNANDGEVLVLDKFRESGLNIETYREQVRHWVHLYCPLSSVRLRRAVPQSQSLRKAA